MTEPASITAERFRAALEATGWSGHHLARRLSVDERQVRRWSAGTAPVPPQVGEWLEQVAAYLEAHPAPAGNVRSRRAAADPAEQEL